MISKSHPLWQVHAQSHLTRDLKIPPPLASTCTVSSYTSYQNPTPSGKYMHSLIFHVISKSHPLWQLHAQSHLTHHIKIPPPLASTCTVSSYISYQNPTPSGKYMHSLIFHVISKCHPFWQVHAQSHLTRDLKIPPPLQVWLSLSSDLAIYSPIPEHFVRFLEGDDVFLASQAEMIAKDSENTVDDADAKLRKRLGGRPLQLPSASAWSTLEHIRKQHAKKIADKKRDSQTCSSILAFSNTRTFSNMIATFLPRHAICSSAFLVFKYRPNYSFDSLSSPTICAEHLLNP